MSTVDDVGRSSPVGSPVRDGEEEEEQQAVKEVELEDGELTEHDADNEDGASPQDELGGASAGCAAAFAGGGSILAEDTDVLEALFGSRADSLACGAAPAINGLQTRPVAASSASSGEAAVLERPQPAAKRALEGAEEARGEGPGAKRVRTLADAGDGWDGDASGGESSEEEEAAGPSPERWLPEDIDALPARARRLLRAPPADMRQLRAALLSIAALLGARRQPVPLQRLGDSFAVWHRAVSWRDGSSSGDEMHTLPYVYWRLKGSQGQPPTLHAAAAATLCHFASVYPSKSRAEEWVRLPRTGALLMDYGKLSKQSRPINLPQLAGILHSLRGGLSHLLEPRPARLLKEFCAWDAAWEGRPPRPPRAAREARFLALYLSLPGARQDVGALEALTELLKSKPAPAPAALSLDPRAPAPGQAPLPPALQRPPRTIGELKASLEAILELRVAHGTKEPIETAVCSDFASWHRAVCEAAGIKAKNHTVSTVCRRLAGQSALEPGEVQERLRAHTVLRTLLPSLYPPQRKRPKPEHAASLGRAPSRAPRAASFPPAPPASVQPPLLGSVSSSAPAAGAAGSAPQGQEASASASAPRLYSLDPRAPAPGQAPLPPALQRPPRTVGDLRARAALASGPGLTGRQAAMKAIVGIRAAHGLDAEVCSATGICADACRWHRAVCEAAGEKGHPHSPTAVFERITGRKVKGRKLLLKLLPSIRLTVDDPAYPLQQQHPIPSTSASLMRQQRQQQRTQHYKLKLQQQPQRKQQKRQQQQKHAQRRAQQYKLKMQQQQQQQRRRRQPPTPTVLSWSRSPPPPPAALPIPPGPSGYPPRDGPSAFTHGGPFQPAGAPASFPPPSCNPLPDHASPRTWPPPPDTAAAGWRQPPSGVSPSLPYD